MVFQIWTRFKLIHSKYYRWFNGQPAQMKGRLFVWIGRQAEVLKTTLAQVWEKIWQGVKHLEKALSVWLSIQVEMDTADKTKCHGLILRSFFKYRGDWETTWLNHVIAVAFQLLSLFIPGGGREEKKAGKGQQAKACCKWTVCRTKNRCEQNHH